MTFKTLNTKAKTYFIIGLMIFLVAGYFGVTATKTYLDKHTIVETSKLSTYESAHRAALLSNYYSDQSEKIWGSSAHPATIRLIEEIDNIIADTTLKLHPSISTEKILGICSVESGFNENIVSTAGAVGMMQVLESTGKGIDKNCTKEKLKKRKYNLRIGIQYYSQLLYQFGGDSDIALLAYNRGPGTVSKLLSSNINPDNGYSDKVYEHTLTVYEYQTLALNN